jgi:hypothetical protein
LKYFATRLIISFQMIITTKETSDIGELRPEDFKLQMKRIKKELKSWEQEFLDVNGRKPEKKDIAGVPEIGIFIVDNSYKI